MNVYGIEVAIKNTPVLDKGFIPMAAFTSAFEASAKNGKDIAVAVERNQGQVAVRRLKIHGTPAMDKADKVYVERTVKMLLWAYGGWKVVVCGDEALGRYIAEAYAPGGARAFDADFMGLFRLRTGGPEFGRLPHRLRRRRKRPQGLRGGGRRARLFRRGGLVSQDQQRPRLSL